MGKIYFMTSAYNAEKTLARCVDSVLNQTYRGEDIIYYICDNGSVDHTGEMIREYAARDARVRPFFNRKNKVWESKTREFLEFRHSLCDDDFLCFLDADDAYELTLLEEMLPFAERNRLDIAICGTVMLDAATERLLSQRTPGKPLLYRSAKELAEGLPYYHQYMRPQWGKLFSGRAARGMYTLGTEPEEAKKLIYGKDTYHVFSALRHAKSVGIYPRILHRYYISPKSVSYQWDENRILSDRILCNDIIDFLSAFGPISSQNRNFLQCVYSNAVTDTIGVIQNAALSPADKLGKYRAIASHPLTLAAYRECTDESAVRSRKNLIVQALKAGSILGKQDDSDLCAVMQTLLPRCGQIVTAANARMFLDDCGLLQAMLRDDADTVLSLFLGRLRDNKDVKKYAVAKAIRALAVTNPLLCQIDDAVFLRKYGDIYEKIWKEEYLVALDEMAGLLIEDQVSGGRETFLSVFISLAAMKEQIPAFIFGKLQLAKLYLRQGRLKECRAAVAELVEMGLDDEELTALRRELEDAQ